MTGGFASVISNVSSAPLADSTRCLKDASLQTSGAVIVLEMYFARAVSLVGSGANL